MKPLLMSIKRFFKKLSEHLWYFAGEHLPVRNALYLSKLKKTLSLIPHDAKDIHNIFRNIGDDFWAWLFTDGFFQEPRLAEIMPSMPPEKLQVQCTGSSFKPNLYEAFYFYRFVKQVAAQQCQRIGPDSRILDFGCGWGRVIRFFLKDILPSNLYGIDCDEELINLCRQPNLPCSFNCIHPMPPTGYEDHFFNIIYAYSVFSHLSERAHKLWLDEFKRILQPGGVLIVTTLPREFIIRCAKLREAGKVEFGSQSFKDTAQYLNDYDSGRFVHDPTGGGSVRSPSFYGESCISQKYAEAEWKKRFGNLIYAYYKENFYFSQNIIIVKK